MQVDLCHGPHLPNTGLLKAAAVSAVNRAHWRADVNKEPLQVCPASRLSMPPTGRTACDCDFLCQ